MPTTERTWTERAEALPGWDDIAATMRAHGIVETSLLGADVFGIVAAVDLLRHHPELWPAEPAETAPEPQPLTVAAREALRLLVRAGHEASPSESWDDIESCCICSEPWPCEVEQSRRILADALDTDTEAAALVAVDALQQEKTR